MQHDEYDIGAAFAAIEEELISSMMRNMARHRAEEEQEGIRWSMWQAEQSAGEVQAGEPEEIWEPVPLDQPGD